MAHFLLGRFAQLAIYLLGLTLIVFLLTRLSGDPVLLLLPPNATQQDYDALKSQMGLEKPLPVQYLEFLGHAAQGDLGRSYKWGMSSAQLILGRFPATLELALAAMAIAVALGVTAGIVVAVHHESWLDRVIMGWSLIGQSMPVFWLGLMLILLLAVHWPILPVGGRGSFAHLILPAITLGWYSTALIARMTRSSMLEILQAEYIKFARIKGLPEKTVLFRHALRNALIPIVTISSLQFAILLSGAVVTETVFAWPGIGSVVVDAILAKDYPVIQAAVLLVSVAFFLVNFFVDLLYMVIDPRIKAS